MGLLRRLDVRGVPRFGTEDAEERGGVKGPCTDLHVVGLPDHAALIRPEFLKFEYEVLKIHDYSAMPLKNLYDLNSTLRWKEMKPSSKSLPCRTKEPLSIASVFC